jgi:hypothetical protein
MQEVVLRVAVTFPGHQLSWQAVANLASASRVPVTRDTAGEVFRSYVLRISRHVSPV